MLRRVHKKSTDKETTHYGWTPTLIDRLNGLDRIDIELDEFVVTTALDAQDYAHATRCAQSDVDACHDMSSLFEDPPSGKPSKNHFEITAEAEGRDKHTGLRCLIEIIPKTAQAIAETGNCGILFIDSIDRTFYETVDSQGLLPVLNIGLYDVNDVIIGAIRRGFNSQTGETRGPTIRVMLASEMHITWEMVIEPELSATPINKTFTWEVWKGLTR